MEAGLKSLRVPSKTTTVTTGFNVMPLTAVVITVGGKKYSIRTNRGWITTHYDQTGAEELYRSSFAGDANICTPDGTETIGGDMTDVFNSNYRNGDGSRVHERIWISEATGLPVREQASIIGGLNLTKRANTAKALTMALTIHGPRDFAHHARAVGRQRTRPRLHARALRMERSGS